MATAVALAKERDASVDALFVILVPLEQALDAPLHDLEEQAAASLAEAALLGEENGVRGRADHRPVRARSARRSSSRRPTRDADLIVLGSSPRWRRQSAFFSPDRRLRAPQRALRGARRRVPAGRARGRRLSAVKLVVIGCGRVGSAVARDLAEDGWDVTAVDEQEEALARLGARWSGGFVVGHGMDAEILRRAGVARRRRRRRRDERRQHEPRHRPGGREALRRPDASSCACSTRRAPTSTPRAGCSTVCPTQTAISALAARVRKATPLRRWRA